jgi:hypothetical protein
MSTLDVTGISPSAFSLYPLSVFPHSRSTVITDERFPNVPDNVSGWGVSNRINDDEKQGMIDEILIRADYRFVAISPQHLLSAVTTPFVFTCVSTAC